VFNECFPILIEFLGIRNVYFYLLNFFNNLFRLLNLDCFWWGKRELLGCEGSSSL
jgi:hypothetical protein